MPFPTKESSKVVFDTKECVGVGALNIDGEHVDASFHIPDCLEPPKKSFIWQDAILMADRPFHCQVKLVIIDPDDGSFLRRTAATSTRNGAIEFVSSGGDVFARAYDSDLRGRRERIMAKARERKVEYLVGTPDEKGRTRINNAAYLRILIEAEAFIDSHPSVSD